MLCEVTVISILAVYIQISLHSSATGRCGGGVGGAGGGAGATGRCSGGVGGATGRYGGGGGAGATGRYGAGGGANVRDFRDAIRDAE